MKNRFYKTSATSKDSSVSAAENDTTLFPAASDATIMFNNKQADQQALLESPSSSEELEDKQEETIENLESSADKDQVLNVISVESSLQSSIEADESTASYSSFHDSGGPLENPTSYILHTYSDGEDKAVNVYRDDTSSNYSSQRTLKLSQGSYFINTPNDYMKYDIKSAPSHFTGQSPNILPKQLFSSRTRIPSRISALNAFRGPYENDGTSDTNRTNNNDPYTGNNYTSVRNNEVCEDRNNVNLDIETERCNNQGEGTFPEGQFCQAHDLETSHPQETKEPAPRLTPKWEANFEKASSRLFRPQSQSSHSRKPLDSDPGVLIKARSKSPNKESDIKISSSQSPAGINTGTSNLLHGDSPKTGNAGIGTSNAEDWGSALPAVMYPTTVNEHVLDTSDDNNVSARQAVQASLLEGNSLTGSQREYMNVIKRNLSRNKSIKSAKFNQNKPDSPPLLFSQDKNALSRSLSKARGNKEENTDNLHHIMNCGADGLSGHPTDDKKKYPHVGEDEGGSSDNSSCKVEEDTDYAALTHGTELKCLDSNEAAIDNSKFIKPAKEPLLLFKGTQAGDQKNSTNNYRYFRNTSMGMFTATGGGNGKYGPDDVTAKNKEASSETKYSITIWILIMALTSVICIFVPFIIIYARGNADNAERYLNNITPKERNIFLGKFDWYHSQDDYTFTNGTFDNRNNNTGNQNISANVPQKSKVGSESIAGVSLFENIPKKYQKNEEIQLMMNNTELRNVFYGIDYAPRNVIYPICGATMHEVMLDVALLSQVTSRLRTYGTQCNQAKFILDSIRTLNLNVSLSMGVWIGPNDDINELQIQDMKSLLKSYPRNLFESLFIGNEVLFREEQTPGNLVKYIKEAKDFVRDELKWNLPVGTSELASKVNADVMKASDIFGSNTHPFFAGSNVQLATKWVYDFIKYQIEPIILQSGNKDSPEIVISEVGWPYQGGKFRNAIAGKRHMQYFLNNWVCEANEQQYPWYYFEAFDEPWKQVYHTDKSKYETEWGLFTAERKLKEDIVFPICS